MPTKCCVCNIFINRHNKGVNCSTCSNPFHINCGGISNDLFKKIEQGQYWRCSTCRRPRTSLVIAGTPTSSIDAPEFHTATAAAAVGTFEQEQPIGTMVTGIVVDLKNEIANVQNSFPQSLTVMNNKIDELQKLSTKVDQHDVRIQHLESDNAAMKSTIKSITIKSDVHEQALCANKLQFNDVPYAVDENLCDIVKLIGSKLRITISNNDICDVIRLKQQLRKAAITTSSINIDDPAQTNTDALTPPNRSPIIVEFNSKIVRNNFLAAYRKDNAVYFDNNKKQKIYINEYLCPSNRKLFYKAKLYSKEHGFKYLWTKDGEILMKKADGSKVIRINRFTDFSILDGTFGGDARQG